jgi:Ca2+-binding RTX toxin-like protein
MDSDWPRILCACVLALLGVVASASDGVAAAASTPACGQGPTREGEVILGTPCADTIVAPAGVAEVRGGGGNDVIVPAPVLASASCPEECRLGIGSQTFEGGPGDDVVYGERGNDRLYGGEGNDRLYGGIGDDLLRGGPGDDLLSGGFGADSIDGEEGDDYVRGDATQDEIVDRGGGFDTLSYATGVAPGFFNSHSPPIGFSSIPGLPPLGGERGVYLDLSGAEDENGDDGVAPFGGGVDEVEGADFEAVIGTPFSDYIVGSDRAETFYGGGGADVILAGNGDDTLYGGADGDRLEGEGGSDTIDGGPGSDRCGSPEAGASCERGAGDEGVVPRDQSKVTAGLLAPAEARYSQLYLSGSNGRDEVSASYAPGAVTFSLGPGSTAAFAGASTSEGCDAPAGATLTCPLAKPLDSIVIFGFGGDDALEASSFPRSVAVVISGGEGDDTVTGGEQSEDVLVDGTGEGSDVLEARGGDDALTNNEGVDHLHGGTGNDLLLSNSLCDGDALDGGADRDNASWSKFQGSAVDAHLDTGQAGEVGAGGMPECGGGTLDSLQAIEDLEGTGFGDVFYGDGGENQLLGWGGEDEYSAGGDDDRILANSGDFDPRIECGEGNDTAFVDFPVLSPHDVAAPDCEQVHEAPKNVFRAETELEVPPVSGAPPPPPFVKPIPKEPKQSPPPRRSCVAASRPGPLRCAVEPRRLDFGPLGRVDGIRWHRWGARRATGFGRLTLLLGHRRPVDRAAARVRVGEPESCRSRRWYRRITVTYGGGYHRAFLRGALSQTPCS